MNKIKAIYWQDGDFWIGYLEQYPEYQTQGMSLDELKENLKDIHSDIQSGELEGVRKIIELEV
jgi:hypothetical protein